MKYIPTIAIVLDTRTKLKDGRYPVRLRATFQVIEEGEKRWVRKYYDTGYKYTEKDFASVMGKTRIEEFKRAADALRRLQAKALDICDKNTFVSPELFQRLYTGSGGNTVLGMFERYIAELKEYGQVGTAANYGTAMRSFKEYAKGDFSFVQVSEDWLKKYQKWMTAKKIRVATIAIYLRCLRKIFNDAIAYKHVSADLYPFGRRQFVIQSVRSPKHALNEKEKNQVLAYKGPEQKAVDFWIMSYFCNGMNFSDIARLKYGDIEDDMIYLIRGKTASTSRQVKKIEIPLRAEVKAIIRKYGIRSLDPRSYVFSVLDEGLTPMQQKNRIHDFIDKTNQGLKRAGVSLGFAFKFTTYTARHTFATISMRNGASKAFIQEALGHSSMQTTDNYLAGFDKETKRKASERL